MATSVTKKDGSKQSFDEGKIKGSIQLACQDAGISPERTAEIVNQVLPSVLTVAAAREEVATSELREAILREMEAKEPAAAEAWRKHETAKGS